MKEIFNIIIPVGINPYPKPHEISAAEILAKYFHSDVIFTQKTNQVSPDVIIKNQAWELKSPLGSSANTIQRNLREASRQSSNVVLDLRRIKLQQSRALGYMRAFLKNPNRIKHLVVIRKDNVVLDII